MSASAIELITIPATTFHLGRDIIRDTVVKAAMPPITALNGTAVNGSVVPANARSKRSESDWMSAQVIRERIKTETSKPPTDSIS